MQRKILELGIKSGRLTVINNNYGKNKHGHYLLLCLCDCGNQIKLVQTDFVNGHTQSCGCLWYENTIKAAKNRSADKRSRKRHPSLTTARRLWHNGYRDGCSFERFLELSQKPCYYCGAEPSNTWNAYKNSKCSQEWKEAATFIYNGLDRIDSSKKHTEDNIVTSCYLCNRAKMQMTQKEFYSWLQRISNKSIAEGRIHHPYSIRPDNNTENTV